MLGKRDLVVGGRYAMYDSHGRVYAPSSYSSWLIEVEVVNLKVPALRGKSQVEVRVVGEAPRAGQLRGAQPDGVYPVAVETLVSTWADQQARAAFDAFARDFAADHECDGFTFVGPKRKQDKTGASSIDDWYESKVPFSAVDLADPLMAIADAHVTSMTVNTTIADLPALTGLLDQFADFRHLADAHVHTSAGNWYNVNVNARSQTAEDLAGLVELLRHHSFSGTIDVKVNCQKAVRGLTAPDDGASGTSSSSALASLLS